MNDCTIRAEAPGDEPAIHALIAQAFAPMPFADGDEQELVDQLRAEGDLAISLVAVATNGAIVGHIGFSPVTIDHADCGWFQMAPVSVTPARQRQGIGSALIKAGIDALRQSGAQGVAVVGNPAYYERFGFTDIAGLAPLSEHDRPYFRAQVLSGSAPRGTLRYAAAFG